MTSTIASPPRPEPMAPGALGRWPRAGVPLVGLLVVAGIVLRLWSHSPLWLDEVQTVQLAKVPLSDLPAALKTDGAPPLYYVLLHGWISAFGDGVWTVRAPAMLASVLSLPLAWLVARRLGASREVAATALVLFAVNPWSVRYAGEARMYSLVALEVLLGTLALLRLRERVDRLSVLAVAASTVCLLYTHYWAEFLLTTVGAGLLWAMWRRPHERAFAARAVLGLVLGGLSFLPWVPTMLYQARHTGSPWANPPGLHSLTQLPQDWYGGNGPAGTLGAVLLVAGLVVAVFARRGVDGRLRLARPTGLSAALAAVSAVTLLLAWAAAMVADGAVEGRYTAVVVPLLLLLLALGVGRLPGRTGAVVLAAFVVVGLSASTTMATGLHSRAGRLADLLNIQARPGDLIVYCPDQLAPAVEARLHLDGVTRLELPTEPNPLLINWVDYAGRIDAISLPDTAAQIEGHVRTNPGAAVWWVGGFKYRTHDQLCGALHSRLLSDLGRSSVLVSNTGQAFERPVLERFAR
ncbi:MAG TPA: glycosyltransferase family 39 protein [Sporichthyaceae bacterium]|nr:glycosyltransferase family 39 protein [Sporichthyaceae bacterium]